MKKIKRSLPDLEKDLDFDLSSGFAEKVRKDVIKLCGQSWAQGFDAGWMTGYEKGLADGKE